MDKEREVEELAIENLERQERRLAVMKELTAKQRYTAAFVWGEIVRGSERADIAKELGISRQAVQDQINRNIVPAIKEVWK